ncbi:MAG: S-layer homology domain-containing protein [Tissierellaceae bacterium]|nr:S-layer homology domain-containing protein [Tissierellaceae bacterium]
MTNSKRMLSLVLALTMIFSMSISALGNALIEFSDIDNHWAREEIDFMTAEGVINGYDDGTFKPDNNMTKAEFYKVINHLMGYEEKAEEVKFEDVKETDWFYEEVVKALAKGYIEDGEKLNPNELITREEVARIIGIVFELEKDARPAREFKDNSKISLAARGYVGALKEKGYIQGYPDGTFGPKNNITRAEVVKMLFNVVEVEGLPEVEEPEEEKPKAPVTPPSSGGGSYTPSPDPDPEPEPEPTPTITGIAEATKTVNMDVYDTHILPTTIEVVMSTGPNLYKAVTWNLEGNVSEDVYIHEGKTFIANKVGEYTLIGALTETELKATWTFNVTNPLIVKTAEELAYAISQAVDGDSIKFENNILSNVELNNLVNLNLNNKTVTGDVYINTMAFGTIDIGPGTIDGNLTVNAPNATVNNYATVTGTITVGEVADETWNEYAKNNTIVVKDNTININIKQGAVVSSLSVEGNSINIVVDGNIETLTIPEYVEGIILSVDSSANISGLVINSPITIISTKPISATVKEGVEIIVRETEDSDPVIIVGDGEKLSLEILAVYNQRSKVSYKSIQAAIDDAQDNDIIKVTAGIYEEQLVIDKAIKLLGPNSGIHGTSEERVEEAVITYPKGLSGYKELINIASENVTIEGFYVCAEEYSKSEDIQTAGIVSDKDNIVVSNNIVDGFNYIPIYMTAYYYDGSDWKLEWIDNIEIKDNFVRNSPDYSAIYMQGASGTVSGNKVENANRAIQVQPYGNPTGGTVINNEFNGFRTGIWYNYARRGAGSWTIENNIVTSTKITDENIDWQGVLIQTFGTEAIGESPKVEFINNTIDGTLANNLSIGIDLQPNINEDAEVIFINNTISNVDVGLNKASGSLELDITLNNNVFPDGSKVIGNQIKLPSNWEDLADTSWYNETNEQLIINTAEELAGLAKLVNDGNTFEGKSINLNSDIDLLNLEWIPIGDWSNHTGSPFDKDKPFKGIFDGNNFKIINLKLDNPMVKYSGLFGAANGTIMNLNISNFTINSLESVGGLVGSMNGTVSNVSASNITINSSHWAGGLIGYSYANVSDSTVDGVTITLKYDTNINDNGDKGGGLIGFLGESVTVENCFAKNVNITGVRDVGGLIGNASGKSNIKNCNVINGKVSAIADEEHKNNSPYAGGVVGRASGVVTLFNSTATGITVESYKEGFIGELVGGPEENVTIAAALNENTGVVYEAIQSAIDAADEGDTILIAAGTYDIGKSRIVIDKGINLIGAGYENTTIKGTVHRAGEPANDIVQPMFLTTSTSGETLVKGISFEWCNTEDIGNNWYSALSLAGNNITVAECKVSTNIPETSYIAIVNIGRSGGSVVGEAGVPAEKVTFRDNIVNGTISIVPSVLGKQLKATISGNIINAVNMEGIWSDVLNTDDELTLEGNTIVAPEGMYDIKLMNKVGKVNDLVDYSGELISKENNNASVLLQYAVATVTTEEKLRTALTDSDIETIYFANNINLSETLKIERPVVIDGKTYSVDKAINIAANDVTIKNLKGNPVNRNIHGLSGIESGVAFYVSPGMQGVELDSVIVNGGDYDNGNGVSKNSIGIMGSYGASLTILNSNISNVTTGIFTNSGNSNGRNTITVTNNTFTNVWAGIGGTEKTDLTATGNNFVTIQDGGEGIGLGNGVNVIGPTDLKTDIKYLKSNNNFDYAIGNKVMDYRLEGIIDTTSANPARLAKISQGYSVVVPLTVGTYQGATVVISLYDANDELMQANTMAKDDGLTNSTSTTFDTIGDFDYVGDGYWTVYGSIVGKTEEPSKAVIEITLKNGKELTHVITEFWN